MAWATTSTISLDVPAIDPEESNVRLRSLWLWQLMLGAVAAVVVVAIAVLDVGVLAIPPVAIGMTGIFLTTIAALVIPWRTLPESATTVLPYLDIVWIGFLTFSTELRLSHLWVFPIAWLATQFSLPRLVGGLAVVALVTLIEVLVNETSRASALRVIIALISLTFIGITINGAARHANAYRVLLRRQARRSTETLAQVSVEKHRVSDTLDRVDIGIARFGRGGELLSANRAYRELYALDPADPTRPPQSIEYDALRGRALRTSEQTQSRAARGELLDEQRVWLYDPHGAWHALSVTTTEQESDGEEASTVLIARDVTDMLQAESRRDDLAAVVSHELRNPLTAVLGHTDRLLEDDDLDPEVRRRLEIIEESGERMMRLVSTILTASPERALRSTREDRSRTDLRAILESSVDAFETQALKRGVGLELRDGAPIVIWADGFRLRQVVDNLLSNAVKYTPPGGSVRVTATSSADQVEIVVRDSGIGIADDDLPRIYEDYFRSAAARESGIPGTGLGMRIARDIIESHGGSIEVRSEPGAGTTVTARLPLEAA